MSASLVGSEMCIRDSCITRVAPQTSLQTRRQAPLRRSRPVGRRLAEGDERTERLHSARAAWGA
eukprot:7009514-Alexandrium_andersonii.AAC.1